MVEFTDLGTITQSAGDFVRIIMLQRYYDFHESLENYDKLKLSNSNAPINIVRARLRTYFRTVRCMLKRKTDKDTYDYVKQLCYNGTTYEEITTASEILDEFLDRIKLIAIDTKKDYDKLKEDSVAYNAEFGLG
jgi:hypothetical protein